MCLSSSPRSDDASTLSPCAMARCETPTCLAFTRTTGKPSFLVDPSGADVLAADGASANKLAGMRSVEDVGALAVGTADRFGALPEALANLLAIVRLRIVGATSGIASVRLEGDEVVIFSEGLPFAQRLLPRLPSGVRVGRNQVRVNRNALGPQWTAAIEALMLLVSGRREATPA